MGLSASAPSRRPNVRVDQQVAGADTPGCCGRRRALGGRWNELLGRVKAGGGAGGQEGGGTGGQEDRRSLWVCGSSYRQLLVGSRTTDSSQVLKRIQPTVIRAGGGRPLGADWSAGATVWISDWLSGASVKSFLGSTCRVLHLVHYLVIWIITISVSAFDGEFS